MGTIRRSTNFVLSVLSFNGVVVLLLSDAQSTTSSSFEETNNQDNPIIRSRWSDPIWNDLKGLENSAVVASDALVKWLTNLREFGLSSSNGDETQVLPGLAEDLHGIFITSLLNEDPEGTGTAGSNRGDIIIPNVYQALLSMNDETGPNVPWMMHDFSPGYSDSYPQDMMKDIAGILPKLGDVNSMNGDLNELSASNGAGTVSDSLTELDRVIKPLGFGKFTDILSLSHLGGGGAGGGKSAAQVSPSPWNVELYTIMVCRKSPNLPDCDQLFQGPSSQSPIITNRRRRLQQSSFSFPNLYENLLSNQLSASTASLPTLGSLSSLLAQDGTKTNGLPSIGESVPTEGTIIRQPGLLPSSFGSLDSLSNIAPIPTITPIFPTLKAWKLMGLNETLIALPDTSVYFNHLGDNLGNSLGYSLGSGLSNAISGQANYYSAMSKSFMQAAQPVIGGIKELFNRTSPRQLQQSSDSAANALAAIMQALQAAKLIGSGVQQVISTINTTVTTTPTPSNHAEVESALSFLLESLTQQVDESEEEEVPSCAISGKAYTGRYMAGLNNVGSMQKCQIQCQLYSSPLSLAPALKTAKSENCFGVSFPCLGVSYNSVTGRCILHFDIDETSQSSLDEYFMAAPVLCANQAFSQTLSQGICLLDALGVGNVPGMNSTTIRANNALVQYQAEPEMDFERLHSQLPDVTDTSAELSATSIWRYNPEIPTSMESTTHETNEIKSAYYFGYNGLTNGSYWGSSHGVRDWRDCQMLCNEANSPPCAYWAYRFDPQIYATQQAACYFFTDEVMSVSNETQEEQSHENTESLSDNDHQSFSVQYIVGSKLSKDLLPSSLFGTSSSEETLASRRLRGRRTLVDETTTTKYSGAALFVPRLDNGNFYKIMAESFSYSNMTSSVECKALCNRVNGCAAYQYLPSSQFSMAQNLVIENSPCLLLTMKTGDGTLLPRYYRSVPWMESEVMSNVTEKTETPLSPNIAKQTCFDTQNVFETVTTESFISENCKFGDGISINGNLLANTENVILGVCSPNDCQKMCARVKDECLAFTWMHTRVCYLFQAVSGYVKEPNDLVIVSGFSDCEANQQTDWNALFQGDNNNSTSSLSKNKIAVATDGSNDRPLATCGEFQIGFALFKGSEAQSTSIAAASAQHCFNRCRSALGCTYMTYDQKLEMCTMMSEATSMPFSAVPIAPTDVVSAAAECDYKGTPNFAYASDLIDADNSDGDGKWSAGKTAGVVVGSVGGAALIGVTGWLAYGAWRRQRKTNDKESTLSAGNLTYVGTPIAAARRLRSLLTIGMLTENSTWSFIRTPGGNTDNESSASPAFGIRSAGQFHVDEEDMTANGGGNGRKEDLDDNLMIGGDTILE